MGTVAFDVVEPQPPEQRFGIQLAGLEGNFLATKCVLNKHGRVSNHSTVHYASESFKGNDRPEVVDQTPSCYLQVMADRRGSGNLGFQMVEWRSY